MSKSKTSLIPLNMIKDFENRLRKEGFLKKNQRLSSLSIESFVPASTAGNKSVPLSATSAADANCKRWIYVPTRVWDEELKRYITVRVKTCIE